MSAPFKSYAQHFEDVMLHRALTEVEAGFYIDIGAQDPDIDSVSKAFFERGWRGVHVEPSPDYAQRLRAARVEDTVIEAAASNRVGTAALTVFPKTGLSTVEAEVARAHVDAGQHPGPEVVTVPTVTLASIARELQTDTVHWLKIDVEGHERAVLEGWDPDTLRPWIVVVEATRPNAQIASYGDWEPILLAADYRCVYDDGLNRFYLASDQAHLARAFSCPPNPFDEIRLSRHAALCQDVVADYDSRLREQMGRYQTDVEALNQQVQTLNQQIQTLNQQVQTLNQQVQTLNQQEQMLTEHNSHLRYEADLLRAQCNELDTRLSGVLASLSWRVTRPLRQVAALAMGLFGGPGPRGADEPAAPARHPEGTAGPGELSPDARIWAARLRRSSDKAED